MPNTAKTLKYEVVMLDDKEMTENAFAELETVLRDFGVRLHCLDLRSDEHVIVISNRPLSDEKLKKIEQEVFPA